MKKNHFGVMLPVFLCIIVRSAFAQVSGIYVEYYSDQNPNDGWAAVPGFPNRHAGQAGLPSGSNVTISNAGTVPYRVFAVSPTTTDIGDVAISGTGSTQPVYLTIGRFTDSNRTPTSVKRLDVGGFMRARAVGR